MTLKQLRIEYDYRQILLSNQSLAQTTQAPLNQRPYRQATPGAGIA